MKVKRIARGLIVALVVSHSFMFTACDQDKLKEADKAVARIASYLDSAIDLKRSAHLNKLIDDGEELAITKELVNVSKALRIFKDKAASYTTFTASAKQDLLKLFADVLSGIASLNENGVLHIKNEDVRARLGVFLAGLSTAAATVQTILAVGGVK